MQRWSERFEINCRGCLHHYFSIIEYICGPSTVCMYVDNLNVFLKYGQLLVKVREFCSTIAAPSINNHHFNKKDSTVDSTQCSAEIHCQLLQLSKLPLHMFIFPDKFVSWHMATSQWTIKFLVGQTLTLNWTS